METNKNIIWLASYPKSGNTWFRAFISALFSEKEIDINQLGTDGIFSDKLLFEQILDLDADEVKLEFVETWRRAVYRYHSAKCSKKIFIKIHDAYTFSEIDLLPLIPTEPSKMAIYLVRNPLDVTLSLANHTGRTIDKTIDKLITNAEGAIGIKPTSNFNQFYQPLGTWSMHVETWKNNTDFPVHFIKYEDMKAIPFRTFKDAVEAMELNFSDTQIRNAIDQTEFEKLKDKEIKNGFKENQNLKSTFFNKGQVGRWKTELSAEQINKIRGTNEPMMRHFGYW